MVQTYPEPVWQLMCGQELYSGISDRELRLLAEFGHLKGAICYGDLDLTVGDQAFLRPAALLRRPGQPFNR